MAYIFGLGVSCHSKEGAEEVFNYLQVASSGVGFGIETGISEHDGDWWASAVPTHPETGKYLWASGGPSSKEDARKMADVAGELYGLLKAGPHFRHAMVAVEAVGWRTTKEVLELLRSLDGKDGVSGLVVESALWREAGSPQGFTKFASGYVHTPFRID